jgi:hypothetical protein
MGFRRILHVEIRVHEPTVSCYLSYHCTASVKLLETLPNTTLQTCTSSKHITFRSVTSSSPRSVLHKFACERDYKEN